ncbi:zinc ribbon domain-containing protein [Nocardia heshunensis]
MMRTYRLPTTANPGKLAAVADLLPWWQRGLVHVQYLQVQRLKAGESTLGWLGGPVAQALPPYLSQRQWKSVVNQANAALESWRAAAVVGVRELIAQRDVDDDLRAALYRINLRKGWWRDWLILNTRTGAEAGQEALRIARELIEAWLWRHPFPNLSRVRTMAMDGPIATVEAATTTRADYWVRLSTRTAGHPVRIPLHGYDYFETAPGGIRNFCQVTVSDDGEVSFALVKKSREAPARHSGKSLGLDWGVVGMFTTSTGQILGQQMYAWLVARDGELTALAAALQRQGITPAASNRYRALNARIRGYVRNEVGRLLNQVAAQDVREIVVEKLDFRHGGLSKRMNRILTRAGRAAVTAKLASLTEIAGITVTEVNSAHTSRACSGCQYVDARNRRSQQRFACRFCGKKLLADINAARNIAGRSGVQGGWLWWSRNRVLVQLDRDFIAQWRYDPTRLRERPTPRGRSTAAPPPAKSIAT